MPSLERWPIKAEEAHPSHEVRLTLLDNSAFPNLRENFNMLLVGQVENIP